MRLFTCYTSIIAERDAGMLPERMDTSCWMGRGCAPLVCGMIDARTTKLIFLISSGREHEFYLWGAWKAIRQKVLSLDHYECQTCKAKGKYAKATIVHHVKHLKDRPDLALSIWDGDERQLVSLCKACHEAEHPESQRQYKIIRAPVTAERWD